MKNAPMLTIKHPWNPFRSPDSLNINRKRVHEGAIKKCIGSTTNNVSNSPNAQQRVRG